MNWKIVSIVLIILLVGSLGFGAWQYMESQRLTGENDALKQQLDTTAEQLRGAENETQQLRTELGQAQTQLNQTQTQLNQTQTQVAQLQGLVQQLQQQTGSLTIQIEKLQQQWKLRDYTTIGLTFLYSADVSPTASTTQLSKTVITTAELSKTVQDMNRQWDPLHIYFFIYHAVEVDFLPVFESCQPTVSGIPSWAAQASALYPGNDIPIAILGDQAFTYGGPACVWMGPPVIAVAGSNVLDITVLEQELISVLGVPRYTATEWGGGEYLLAHGIPHDWWYTLITNAAFFEMPIPEEGS